MIEVLSRRDVLLIKYPNFDIPITLKKGPTFMLLTGIIAVDQHWGAIDPVRYRYEMNMCLFNRIEHMKKLDFIMFGGDTFNMKEYVSSDTFKEVLRFIHDLILITDEFNTEIVFIEGTRTHDSLQLDTLSIIFNTIFNCSRIKFISKVCEDKIGDMNILYLPEEYISNQKEYYKSYFEKHYDLILGHGITDKIWYASKNKSDDLNHHTTAPIFSVDQLCEVGNYVYFGHIHEHKSYGPNNRFTSVGPSTIWEYGKGDECGYYIVEYDTQSCLMMEEFVPNENAPKLVTKALSIKETITVDELDHKLDNILKLSKDVDGLRIIITMDDRIENFDSLKDFVITRVGQYPNTKLVLKIESIEDDELTDYADNEDKETTGKILESTKTPIENQIANFVLYKRGKNISLDYIKDLLDIRND